MDYTIKQLERYGFETFRTTMIDRHPDWQITTTNNLESEKPSFEHYDVDVVTPEECHYEVEIKTRPEYTITSFPDLEIDETKVNWIQDDLKKNKCDRAFLCGIYPQNEEMVIWEIKQNCNYPSKKSYRPKKTAETDKVEFVEKSMVAFPMEGGKKIKIKTKDDGNE